MTNNDLLQKYPAARIKPVDGMAVTADVWEEAHNYHRNQQNFHNLLSHGAGIVSGLKILASDPADSAVYILPGVAIDSAGQVIVLDEPVAYDLGDDIEGFLYLLLSHSEGQPRSKQDQKDGPQYVHAEFTIVARSTLPDTPTVELARLTRDKKIAKLRNAENPLHPAANELDLRYRRSVGAQANETISLAVSYLGEVTEKVHGNGAGHMAQEVNQGGQLHVVVDDDITLDPNILNYRLIYLVGEGDFKMSASQSKGLQGYVERGGTLFIEAVDDAAGKAFAKVLKSMKIDLEELGADHPVMQNPYVFATPPAGYTEEAGGMQAVDGVIVSGNNYGRLWRGERDGATPRRADIRAGMEWGTNLIAYSQQRREQVR